MCSAILSRHCASGSVSPARDLRQNVAAVRRIDPGMHGAPTLRGHSLRHEELPQPQVENLPILKSVPRLVRYPP